MVVILTPIVLMVVGISGIPYIDPLDSEKPAPRMSPKKTSFRMSQNHRSVTLIIQVSASMHV